jgi:hypothetical protein
MVAHSLAPALDSASFAQLQHYGIFRQDVEFRNGRLRSGDGEWIDAIIADPVQRERIVRECLGVELRNGKLIHAGFFLGPRAFYAQLRTLPESERQLIDMRGVGYVNQLEGDDRALRVAQRTKMRCVNTTMMVTVLGAAVSDGLADGRVVSGVGGQYNFVAMAHALADARSILCVRATRTKAGVVSSNIVTSYGHVTIPRHLRDIVITEYGIADLRGKTDSECIAAMLNLADSRFQDELLADAKRSGKIAASYVIPEHYRNNTPEQLAARLREFRNQGLFSAYPFGTDLSAEEITLGDALRALAAGSATRLDKLRTAIRVLLHRIPTEHAPLLARMGLQSPANRHERWLAKLVSHALSKFSPR